MSDLNDKKRLADSLAEQRDAYAQLESDFQDLQSKFLKLKEELENQDEKMSHISREMTIDNSEIEEAIQYLRQKRELGGSEPSSFLDKLESSRNGASEKELSEMQIQLVETINELDKTRNLLRIQSNINDEQKKEIEILHKRIGQVRNEYVNQISEYQKLLELRAAKIQKLETEVKNIGPISRSPRSDESLFQFHIQRIALSQEILLSTGVSQPNIFASWIFYESEQSYTPVLTGPVVAPESSSYYKVRLDSNLLEYIQNREVLLQLHILINDDCETLAQTRISFSEILEYPNSKLHKTLSLRGLKGSAKDQILGTIDYWFRLHANNTNPITNFLEDQRCEESRLQRTLSIHQDVDFLHGEEHLMLSDKVEIKKKKTFLQRKREAMQVKKTAIKGETSSEIDDVRHKVKESAMEPSTESSTNQEEHTTTPEKDNEPIEKEEQKTSPKSPIASTSKTETMQRIKSPIKVKGLSELPKLEPITKSSSKESNKSETRGRKDSVSKKQSKPKEELKKKQSTVEGPEHLKPATKTGQVESNRKLFESKASSSSTESTKDSFQAVSKAASSQLQSVSKTRPKPPRTSKLQPPSVEKDPKSVAKPQRVPSKNESKDGVRANRPELQRSVTMEIVETESEEEEKEMEEESDDNSEDETEDSQQSSQDSEEDEEEGSENSDVDDETTAATETNPSHSTREQSHGSDSNSATHRVKPANKGKKSSQQEADDLSEDSDGVVIHREASKDSAGKDSAGKDSARPENRDQDEHRKEISFEPGKEDKRRKHLSDIRSGKTDKDKFIKFCIVAEPEEDEENEDFDEIGYGKFDLSKLKGDLVDHSITIKNSKGKQVGVLTISIIAAKLLKNIK